MGETNSEYGTWGTSELDDFTAAANREHAGDGHEQEPYAELSKPQSAVYDDDTRFRVLVAGRRFGKSYLAVPELIRMAWGLWCDGSDREAWYVAPTYKQARRDIWRPLKRLARPFIAKVNETTMTVELIGGGRISLHGADNYDSLRGAGLNGLVLDEYADIDPEAWSATLRPMLSDRLGRVLFIGTPKGFDHFFDLFNSASERADWAAYQFTTIEGGNVPASEIEAARKDLDALIFSQEYEATFSNIYAGRVYHGFDRKLNVAKLEYDERLPICWALDFNVAWMCSTISQVILKRVNVLEEIVLKDAHTGLAAQAFAERAAKWDRPNRRLVVKVYGDASGNSRQASADRTDYQTLRQFFAAHAERFDVEYLPNRANPTHRARAASMNALLCNAAGERRMMIDPACEYLIGDLERVTWKQGVAEIDKKDEDRGRVHTSDAVGYLAVKEFPVDGFVRVITPR